MIIKEQERERAKIARKSILNALGHQTADKVIDITQRQAQLEGLDKSENEAIEANLEAVTEIVGKKVEANIDALVQGMSAGWFNYNNKEEK